MWTTDDEVRFFNDAIRLNSIENLMVAVRNRYYAFQPKEFNETVVTPQARNGVIGNATEKWCKDFFFDIARQNNLYAVNGVICRSIGLTPQTPADLAFCTTNNKEQSAENIKLIFEIKMGIVNNYLYTEQEEFSFCGDYTTHKGNPSLLRSDSMLKAIGKSVNLRVDSLAGKKIPIIILGNSPITRGYKDKVDCLCQSGVIQKFVSLYPNPTIREHIKQSPKNGFETFENERKVAEYIAHILGSEMNYFSAMMHNNQLGKLIDIASREDNDELKGQKFIELLKQI